MLYYTCYGPGSETRQPNKAIFLSSLSNLFLGKKLYGGVTVVFVRGLPSEWR